MRLPLQFAEGQAAPGAFKEVPAALIEGLDQLPVGSAVKGVNVAINTQVLNGGEQVLGFGLGHFLYPFSW